MFNVVQNLYDLPLETGSDDNERTGVRSPVSNLCDDDEDLPESDMGTPFASMDVRMSTVFIAPVVEYGQQLVQHQGNVSV
jgi:hypothetical protein